MDLSNSSFWFWNIVIIIYFVSKDYLLSKIFKKRNTGYHPFVNLTFAVITLVLNSFLTNQYNTTLNMSYVKGVIKLPPFALIFIFTDFLSTVVVYLLFIIRRGFKALQNSRTFFIIDLTRFVVILVVFTSLLNFYWKKEFMKYLNWDYNCFQNQIVIDFAAYYFSNGKAPQYLEQFTKYKVNPINNSPLIFKPGSTLSATVTDKEGNKIMEGNRVLIGIESYTNDPSRFFRFYEINNETICSGNLQIPMEFDKEIEAIPQK